MSNYKMCGISLWLAFIRVPDYFDQLGYSSINDRIQSISAKMHCMLQLNVSCTMKQDSSCIWQHQSQKRYTIKTAGVKDLFHAQIRILIEVIKKEGDFFFHMTTTHKNTREYNSWEIERSIGNRDHYQLALEGPWHKAKWNMKAGHMNKDTTARRTTDARQ